MGMIAMLVELGGAGCSTKICTEIGCVDGFSATVRRADGSFPSGAHRVEILADGVTHTCTFNFPLEVLPSGGTATPTCSGGGVSVAPAVTCSEIRTDQYASQKCDPIPGQFVETIRLPGTPAQVHVWQYVDDAAILDAAGAPSYAETRPNGPECEPVCRQASASWTMQ
jgi:hypothetical protein